MIRLLAFDPSLINLGVASAVFDGNQLHVDYVNTFFIDKLTDNYSLLPDWGIDYNTRRAAMLKLIATNVIDELKADDIIIEEPIFNGANPKSLQVQMLSISTLENIILKRHESIGAYNKYKPSAIKAAVGIHSRADMSDKGAVTRALIKLNSLNIITYANSSILPTNVDNHANDAVAMLYTRFLELKSFI